MVVYHFSGLDLSNRNNVRPRLLGLQIVCFTINFRVLYGQTVLDVNLETQMPSAKIMFFFTVSCIQIDANFKNL